METQQKVSTRTFNGSSTQKEKTFPQIDYDCRELIEGLPAAIYTCDAEGRITFYNNAAAELWGRKPIIGKDLWCGSWKIYRTDGTLLPLDECPMAITLKEGRPVNGEEIVVERPDGMIVNVLPHPKPIFDSSGKISGAINLLVDITEKKKREQALRESEKKYRELANSLEGKVERRTLELKIRNEELEQYAQVASHDLQEPLRKIQTFANLLEKNIDDKTAVKKNLEKINSSADRMATLIKDVLKYSQFSTNDELFVAIDLNKVFENVKQDFELLIEQKQAIITHSELPVIKGIPIQFHQLFSNLIGNAIKFNNQIPVIEITSEKVNGEVKKYPQLKSGHDYYKIAFKDNGIGFEPQYAEQIFKLFQRLNDTKSGTGIGLAVCKKIVENHKGHIAVLSEANKGTTFIIFLPIS